MTVTSVRKDPEALTLILTAEFDATPSRVWQLWAGSAPARTLVGSPDVACDVHGARPRSGRPRRVPHDRAER